MCLPGRRKEFHGEPAVVKKTAKEDRDLATILHAAEPIDLSRGWSILQDVHSTGEELGLFRENWNPVGINAEVSPWERIPRLAHLQLLLARQPYSGRELRYFNSAPWWHRLQFPIPPGTRHATLRLEGID